MLRSLVQRSIIGRPLVRLRFRMSRLSTRIMAIMLFPLVLFFVGLFSIDQYRTTLIRSEFTALERQGFTLARSLALAQSEIDGGLARRRLSPETMNHLLPLVGYGTDLRARVFRPDGWLLADTARSGAGGEVELRRRQPVGLWERSSRYFQALMRGAAGMIGSDRTLPVYREGRQQTANDYDEVLLALAGEPARQLRQDRQGRLVLSVAVPIQDLRLVRGALLVSISGGKIEDEIAEVNVVFIQLFGIVTLITIALSVYLARSITTPITYLAAEADHLRRSRDLSARMQRLPRRRDEIGRLSESLIDMTDELQRRMAATAGFAADVSHELKNPLSSLRSAAETISRISDPKQQQQLMTIILRDVVRLDRLISDISRASRLDNEMATESARRIDLRDLVESFVTARQATTETQKLRFVAGDNEVPVMVQDGRIVQILDNLLGNAVSFAPAGTSVDFTVSLADDGSACLEVCDQGPGIPEGRLNEVFNRFYSERPEGEAFGEHSGLGLSIAQQIAQGYGGDLVASNRDGACFTLTLPRTEI
ncbi:MAG: stimulus-sensing domain-containing protein [Pseudomonadota bacterium]|nr:stimulus-sensing domain-containing protein [Pseudomonadota bacterium]